MKGTVKTRWVMPLLKDFVPTQPKPKPKPSVPRMYTPEQKARKNAIRRKLHRDTYVSRRKPKPVIEIDALDPMPYRQVQAIDFDALIARLKQGPVFMEGVNLEYLRPMLRYHGILLRVRTKYAIVEGVQKVVIEMRIKE